MGVYGATSVSVRIRSIYPNGKLYGETRRHRSEAIMPWTWLQLCLFWRLWQDPSVDNNSVHLRWAIKWPKCWDWKEIFLDFLFIAVLIETRGKPYLLSFGLNTTIFFCISPNSLTSGSLVSCCACLQAVDVLICGFVIKFQLLPREERKTRRGKAAPQILNLPAARVHHMTWEWLPVLGMFKKLGELVPWSS